MVFNPRKNCRHVVCGAAQLTPNLPQFWRTAASKPQLFCQIRRRMDGQVDFRNSDPNRLSLKGPHIPPPPAKVSFWNLKFSSCFHQCGWFLDPPFALTTFCQPAPGCHLVENFTSTRLECSGALDDRCETNPPIYFGLAIREINTLTKLIEDTFICYFLMSWYTQTKAYFTLWMIQLYQI